MQKYKPSKIDPIVALYQSSVGIVGADPMCLPKKAFGIVADSGSMRSYEASPRCLLIIYLFIVICQNSYQFSSEGGTYRINRKVRKGYARSAKLNFVSQKRLFIEQSEMKTTTKTTKTT